jgi:hypothetical protein
MAVETALDLVDQRSELYVRMNEFEQGALVVLELRGEEPRREVDVLATSPTPPARQL